MQRLVIALLISCFALCNAQFNVSVVAVLPNASNVTVDLSWYPGLTVATAMIEAVTQSKTAFNYAIQYSSAQYGGFVTEICNTPNAAPAYWLYSVNGQSAQVGVDFYVLSFGDQVVWSFTKTEFTNLQHNFISFD